MNELQQVKTSSRPKKLLGPVLGGVNVSNVARRVASYGRILLHWRVLGSASVPYVPEDISIELTNSCNFACDFCSQSDPNHFRRVERSVLSPEQADLLLARLREGGVSTNVIHWTLDGEPFVNKRFAEICQMAIRHGFTNMVFSTNGSLATLERVRELPVAPGVRYTLCVDFCSDREVFESCRGNSGSWQRVLDNLLAVAGDSELEHVHLKLNDISVYRISDRPELEARFQALQALLLESPRITYGRRTFHNATGFMDIPDKKMSSRYHRCPYPWTSFVVASNGDVVGCCRDLERKTVLGNLLHNTFAEVWSSPSFKQLRRALATRSPKDVDACCGCDLPYDDSKFSPKNFYYTSLRRLQLFA